MIYDSHTRNEWQQHFLLPPLLIKVLSNLLLLLLFVANYFICLILCLCLVHLSSVCCAHFKDSASRALCSISSNVAFPCCECENPPLVFYLSSVGLMQRHRAVGSSAKVSSLGDFNQGCSRMWGGLSCASGSPPTFYGVKNLSAGH